MNLGPTITQVEVRRIWLFLGLTMLVFSSPSEARGEAFRNPFQSAAAMGQGNAFTAQADDASAVFLALSTYSHRDQHQAEKWEVCPSLGPQAAVARAVISCQS
jgi:hypothetical protein